MNRQKCHCRIRYVRCPLTQTQLQNILNVNNIYDDDEELEPFCSDLFSSIHRL